MSQEGVTARVELRRNDSSVPWGFRMHGGREYGKPLFIQKVTKNSLAHKAGLEPGDVIVMIGKTNASVYSHQEAKMEIVRSGCDLDFIVQKRKMELPQVNSVPVPQKNSTISEESIHWEGTGAENKQLQSRSFRMLQMHLDESEASENVDEFDPVHSKIRPNPDGSSEEPEIYDENPVEVEDEENEISQQEKIEKTDKNGINIDSEEKKKEKANDGPDTVIDESKTIIEDSGEEDSEDMNIPNETANENTNQGAINEDDHGEENKEIQTLKEKEKPDEKLEDNATVEEKQDQALIIDDDDKIKESGDPEPTENTSEEIVSKDDEAEGVGASKSKDEESIFQPKEHNENIKDDENKDEPKRTEETEDDITKDDEAEIVAVSESKDEDCNSEPNNENTNDEDKKEVAKEDENNEDAVTEDEKTK